MRWKTGLSLELITRRWYQMALEVEGVVGSGVH
jgi:hypothetical protein